MAGTQEIAPGVWRIPVPVARNVPPLVNVYAVESGARFLLVDVGQDEEGLQAVDAGLAAIGAMSADVEGVVLTHGHPDHGGAAAEFQRRTGCWVGVHPHDRIWFVDGGVRTDPDRLRSLLGMPASEIGLSDSAADGQIPLAAPRLTDIPDGALLGVAGRPPRLEAIWSPGHSPGHLCLSGEGGELFSGDHVLMDFAPPLHAALADDSDVVEQFLGSLERTRRRAPGALLPGHGDVVADPRDRIDALAADHRARGTRVRETLALQDGGTAWEITAGLPRSRPWERLSPLRRHLDVLETYVHLRHLVRTGAARSEGTPVRWSAIGAH